MDVHHEKQPILNTIDVVDNTFLPSDAALAFGECLDVLHNMISAHQATRCFGTWNSAYRIALRERHDVRSLTFYTVPGQYAAAPVALRDIAPKVRSSKAGMCDADASASVVWIDRKHLPLLFVRHVVIEVEGLSREVAKPVAEMLAGVFGTFTKTLIA